MTQPHFDRFGSLLSPQGAMYVYDDSEGFLLMQVDIYKAFLQANHIDVTPTIEREIALLCRQLQARDEADFDAQGVPPTLTALLQLTKKSKVIAYSKRIFITQDDLFLLIHNSKQIGFSHRSKFKEYVPEGRRVLDTDFSRLKQGDPRTFLRKIPPIFAERKRYHVHMFANANQWHCFYFTYQDMEDGAQPHWEHGPHLHYISYLWTDHSKRRVWDSVDSRDIPFTGAHIRLRPFNFDQDSRTLNSNFHKLAHALLSHYKERPHQPTSQ